MNQLPKNNFIKYTWKHIISDVNDKIVLNNDSLLIFQSNDIVGFAL